MTLTDVVAYLEGLEIPYDREEILTSLQMMSPTFEMVELDGVLVDKTEKIVLVMEDHVDSPKKLAQLVSGSKLSPTYNTVVFFQELPSASVEDILTKEGLKIAVVGEVQPIENSKTDAPFIEDFAEEDEAVSEHQEVAEEPSDDEEEEIYHFEDEEETTDWLTEAKSNKRAFVPPPPAPVEDVVEESVAEVESNENVEPDISFLTEEDKVDYEEIAPSLNEEPASRWSIRKIIMILAMVAILGIVVWLGINFLQTDDSPAAPAPEQQEVAEEPSDDEEGAPELEGEPNIDESQELDESESVVEVDDAPAGNIRVVAFQLVFGNPEAYEETAGGDSCAIRTPYANGIVDLAELGPSPLQNQVGLLTEEGCNTYQWFEVEDAGIQSTDVSFLLAEEATSFDDPLPVVSGDLAAVEGQRILSNQSPLIVS